MADMHLKIDDTLYPVIINRKYNKNTYIRVKDDLKIYVYTNYLMTKQDVKQLLTNNSLSIKRMLIKQNMRQQRQQDFYYLGTRYDVVIIPKLKDITITDNKILINDNAKINKWYQKQALIIFNERLEHLLLSFPSNFTKPKLRIRKMTTRWGVCNRKDKNITLNLELIKRDIKLIDYVIIHELCHFIHPNHSVAFWDLVSQYQPDYKILRKKLKDLS
ncbi:MAG: M48 family metallopeptidase [Bacilli bacterium]|jgi:predicted metal-dependent hydrolase|nr:SprT family zinc-dependent metalloprotease [Bacilli bacterium]